MLVLFECTLTPVLETARCAPRALVDGGMRRIAQYS